MITAPTSATATETAERGRRGMIKPAQLRPLFQRPHLYQAIGFTPTQLLFLICISQGLTQFLKHRSTHLTHETKQYNNKQGPVSKLQQEHTPKNAHMAVISARDAASKVHFHRRYTTNPCTPCSTHARRPPLFGASTSTPITPMDSAMVVMDTTDAASRIDMQPHDLAHCIEDS